MIRALALTLTVLIALATPAQAGPIGALIGVLSGAAGFTGTITVLGFATSSLAFRLLASVALSSLASALAPKPKAAGIKTSTTVGGDVPPATFILGRYATAGHAVCPAMSHGSAGHTPNAYLTYVIELGDIAGQSLERMMINGEYVVIGTEPHPDYGLPITATEGSDAAQAAWIIYHDGSQSAADPMLLAKYGSYPDRPWSADMIGTGICYAILTFRYNREIYQGFPEVKFEMGGIPLYDPRFDSTVGGSGGQRWAEPASWVRSDNSAVQAYNILRGIILPGLGVWGGEAAEADLPLGTWFAAMNEPDLPMLLEDGITSEPQYRTGFEVGVADEPAAVLEELFVKGCSGALAEIGGIWKARVGAVGLPVWQFTDDDILITAEQSAEPFPGLDATWNAIHASYPEPEEMWEVKDAPPRYNAAWEAADGGRQLVADLALPAVPYALQVQRLMRAYIEEERRFARHTLTLPATAAVLEPLDAVAWTSARHGYAAKVFEVMEVVDNPATLLQTVTLRERDAADYDWVPGFTLPSSIASGAVNRPVVQSVPGWAVIGIALSDAASAERRPALRLAWDASGQDDQRGLEWELRLTGGATVQRGSTASVAAGELVLSDGILPATGYEARAQFVVDRPTEWSAWLATTTPDTRLGVADLDDPVRAAITEALAVRAAAQVMADAALSSANAEMTAVTGPLLADVADVQADLVLAVPRSVAVDDALATVQDQVLALAATLSATQSGVAGAGIYTDPASGTVRIEAISRIDDQIGAVSLTLDAVQADINLRATVAYVDATISAVVLDPTQIPIIDDLDLRVNAVELDLSAVEGAIAAKAETTVVAGMDVTLTQAVLDISSLDAALALKVDQTAFTPLEVRVSDAEITLDAIDGSGIMIAVSDSRALADAIDDGQISSLQQVLDAYADRTTSTANIAYATQDFRALVDENRAAIASVTTELGVAFAAAQALITSEASTRAAADAVEAVIRDQIQVDLGAAQASAVQETQARIDGDGALASDISSLTAVVTDPVTGLATTRADLSALAVTSANADGALAGRADTLEATAAGHTASLSIQSAAIANIDGNMSSTYVFRQQAGQAVGVMEAVVASDPSGVPFSSFSLDYQFINLTGHVTASDLVADQVLINSPGQLGLGVVGNAQIQYLAVDTLQIAGNAVTTPVYVFAPAWVSLFNFNEYIPLAALVLTRQWLTTTFTVSMIIGGEYSAAVMLSILRGDGVEVWSGAVISGPDGYGQAQTIYAVDASLGLGPTTYTLRATKLDYGRWDANAVVFNIYFAALQLKR